MNRTNQTRTGLQNSTQQSDTSCYKYSGPVVDGGRVNQCDERREEELHHQPRHAMQNSAPHQSDTCCYKYSGPLVNGNRVDQCDHKREDALHQSQSHTQNPAKDGPCFKYSGAMVDAARVDQCEQTSHDPKQEQNDHWQPLGLDHQSGYSYLYQHSGYECEETEQEKQAASQAREEHCLD